VSGECVASLLFVSYYSYHIIVASSSP